MVCSGVDVKYDINGEHERKIWAADVNLRVITILDIFRDGESEVDLDERRGHWEQQFERRRKTYEGENGKMSLER